MEVNKKLILLILTQPRLVLFLSGPLQAYGFRTVLIMECISLVSCLFSLDWTWASFHVACSELMIHIHKHRTFARMHRSPFACPFSQGRTFRLFPTCPPYPLNAFMHSCRKTEGSGNCGVIWSCQTGLGRILPQYELGQVTELTSSNFNFPSNGHNTSITQLWRGFNRRPSVKHLARSLMLNNYVPSFFLYITRSSLLSAFSRTYGNQQRHPQSTECQLPTPSTQIAKFWEMKHLQAEVSRREVISALQLTLKMVQGLKKTYIHVQLKQTCQMFTSVTSNLGNMSISRTILSTFLCIWDFS